MLNPLPAAALAGHLAACKFNTGLLCTILIGQHKFEPT